MKQNPAKFRVASMCLVLRVPKAAYCRWHRAPISNKELEDARIWELMRTVEREKLRRFAMTLVLSPASFSYWLKLPSIGVNIAIPHNDLVFSKYPR